MPQLNILYATAKIEDPVQQNKYQKKKKNMVEELFPPHYSVLSASTTKQTLLE